MIIGVLGKGGTGKSTVATQLALFLRGRGTDVLAIDADHNIDFLYNLGGGAAPEGMRYLGGSRPALHAHLGIAPDTRYDEAFLAGVSGRFSFGAETDPFTDAHSALLPSGIRVMAAGPQNDDVLYGQACSHSLSTPLKLYLPLLELSEGQAAVVDEKAGADGASTGIATGVDLAVIVTDPSLHGAKTARQIAGLLDFFEVPYVYAANKVRDREDVAFVEDLLGVPVAAAFSFERSAQRDPGAPIPAWEEGLAALVSRRPAGDRRERTLRKFERQRAYGA